ncbi:MAG: chromosome segregation protein SMC, partial [Ignavibacteria bacterium]|nr:chromosome segregation protein SMC [Ignavibacteria bacterium]
GAKVLIEQSSQTGKKSSIFADIGNAKEDFRFALEAALKSVLNNLLVDSFDNLNSAVKYLKDNDLGKASFYLLQENKKSKSLIGFINNYSIKKKSKNLSREESFVGWSSNFVETESNWLPYFKQVLNNIAVIKDLSSAIELHKKYPEFSFTTLDGDIVHNSGIIEAGSLPKQDETLFGRRQLLENLFNELPKHEASLAKLKASIQQTEEAIASIDLKNLSDQEKLIANDLSNIEKQISQLEFEKKKADEEIEIARKDIQEYVDKANLLHSSLETTESEMAELSKQRIEIDENLSSFESELKESELELNTSLDQFNSSKLELERLRGHITNIESSISQFESNVSSILNGIEKRKKDSVENESETGLLSTVIDESKMDFENINSLRSSLLEQETSISTNLKCIKDEAAQLES